ncbi:MAG TPA: DUF3419 family protein [Candidatus Acidoferrales bacterium]|nr:DUF3419 family protein [Candidatus Acidoferrales bacterium]
MSRPLYSQCWEDPRTLAGALRISPQDDVLSIGSAGDNSLALLLYNPRSLTVIDRNAAQIGLIELKIRALQTLNYEDFVAFLGARPSARRSELYALVRPALSEEARSYWDARRKELLRGVIHCGKLESYFKIFRRCALPLIHSQRTVEKLLDASSLEQQRSLYDQVWNTRRWRSLFSVFFSQAFLSRFGREFSFFEHATNTPIGAELLRRIRRGIAEIPIRDNFFIEYILTGHYRDLQSTHPYLAESSFLYLKKNVNRIRLVWADLEAYLDALPTGSFSKFNLSDIFEYMSEPQFERALRSIARASRPGGKLAFWTLFVPRMIPPSLARQIRPAALASRQFFATDRTFFYGSFTLCDVPSGTAHARARHREIAGQESYERQPS